VIEGVDHHVIASTWAFKCKCYPDGLIKKFKARFCARGDQQLEGIDFFETYAPVVQWTTIRAPLGARAYPCSHRSKSLSLNIE